MARLGGHAHTVTVCCIAPTVHAKLAANTINPQAILAHNDRHLIVTGPIQGTVAGERSRIKVTVTQRSTGAVAVAPALGALVDVLLSGLFPAHAGTAREFRVFSVTTSGRQRITL